VVAQRGRGGVVKIEKEEEEEEEAWGEGGNTEPSSSSLCSLVQSYKSGSVKPSKKYYTCP